MGEGDVTTAAGVPRLRAGVELREEPRGEGAVGHAIEDPVQGVRLTVDRGVFAAAALFDGEHTVEQVSAALGAAGVAMSPAALRGVLKYLDTYYVLDTERARSRVQRVVAERGGRPFFEGGARTLERTDLVALPGARFDCKACGDCCRGYRFGPLERSDMEKIAGHDWTQTFPFVKRNEDLFKAEETDKGPAYYLADRDGHCIFLGDDNLCTIHKLYGSAEKPIFCRAFPFRLVRRPDGRVDVSLRFECSNIHRSRLDGQTVEGQLDDVFGHAREREQIGGVLPLTLFDENVAVPPSTILAIERCALRVLDVERRVEEQLVALKRVVAAAAERLPPFPAADDVRACEAALDAAPAESFYAPGPPEDRGSCIGAFATLIGRMCDAAMRRYFGYRALGLPIQGGEEKHEAVIQTLLSLQRRYADLFRRDLGAPPVDHATAAAVWDAGDDPQVAGLARDALRNAVFSKFPVQSTTLVAGYGAIAVNHYLAKWHAKRLAAARGAARLDHSDLMKGFIAVNRILGDEVESTVFTSQRDLPKAFLLDLFWADGLPA